MYLSPKFHIGDRVFVLRHISEDDYSITVTPGEVVQIPRQRVEPDPDPCLGCRHARTFTCGAEVRPEARVASWVFAGIVGGCENQTKKGASDVRQSD